MGLISFSWGSYPLMFNKAKLTVVTFIAAFLMVACGGGQVGDYTAEKYNQNPLTVSIPSGLDNAAVIKAA